MTSPDEALIGNDVTGNHVTGTGSHMNGSDRVRMHNRFPRFFFTIVVQNVPLRIIGSSMATGCHTSTRHVTLEGWGVGKLTNDRGGYITKTLT